MPRDDIAALVHEDRVRPAPLFNTRRDLRDLGLGVDPGVSGIGDKPIQRPALYGVRRPGVGLTSCHRASRLMCGYAADRALKGFGPGQPLSQHFCGGWGLRRAVQGGLTRLSNFAALHAKAPNRLLAASIVRKPPTPSRLTGPPKGCRRIGTRGTRWNAIQSIAALT